MHSERIHFRRDGLGSWGVRRDSEVQLEHGACVAEGRTDIEVTMTPELWKRLKPLYEAALETSGEQRAQFIAEACKDDALLKNELEKLLQSNTESTFPLENPLIRLNNLFRENSKTLSVGQVLLQRFQIVRHLGSGGMGDVYEALDLHLQKGRIALKVIRPSIAQNPAILIRFKSEVILARKISGPNVCRIHEFFEPTEQSEVDCLAFLTMEFLEGTTLSDRIEAGLVPLGEASNIAMQLCAALQSIHGAGVIHRDLKPRNIMLVPDNGAERAVVMDFGLAHAVSGASLTEKARNTVPGTIMGTPEYMAPEQFEGREVTPATDIYALGLVLYELVTGKRMYAASTPFAAAVRRGRRPDAPSSMRHGVPPAWDDVIAKCLEFDAELRYHSVDEVIDALKQHKLVIWRFHQGQRISLTRGSLIAITCSALLILAFAGWLAARDALAYHMSPVVKRWYDEGAADLREGTYLKAAKEFEMAVQLDEKYPLTHARLAEAWSELDFTGEAQKQLLFATATDPKITLSTLERKYIDAVRTTLIHDYSAAAQDYEAILKDLPKGQRPEGMVDLGRAYEKAGRMHEALERYEEAAKLDPNNPAPFVHLGILKSRMRDPAGADVAFSEAERLYLAESNLEGQAEVDYQRGYAANEVADEEKARTYLTKSLSVARQIKSAQLEARTLSQLSSVEYNSGKDEQAISFANEAVQLAIENDLEYWSTDGLVRLGNAYLDKEDFTNADLYSQKALRLAKQYQHPRIEADAKFTLASIRDQQGNANEEIPFAREALKYYKDYGFMDMAALSSELVVRGEEKKGDSSVALQSGKELIELAGMTHGKFYTEQAEETVGGILLDLERFPEALAHYEIALEASKSLPGTEAYEQLHCADVLWRLGRYSEAEAKLNSINSDARQRVDIASGIEDIRSQMLLSEGRNQEAFDASQKALHSSANVPAAKVASLKRTAVLAELQLGKFAGAGQGAAELAALARKEASEDMIADSELVEVIVGFQGRATDKAVEKAAESANRYFSAKGKRESEWLSLFYLAKSSKDSGDLSNCVKQAKNAVDILDTLKHDWGSQVFQEYIARPDLQSLASKLTEWSTSKFGG